MTPSRASSKIRLRGTDTNSLLRTYDAAAAIKTGFESLAERKCRQRTLDRVIGELRRRGVLR